MKVCEEPLWRMKRIAERRVEIATTVSETEFAANCRRKKKTFLETPCVDKEQRKMSKTLPWINGPQAEIRWSLAPRNALFEDNVKDFTVHWRKRFKDCCVSRDSSFKRITDRKDELKYKIKWMYVVMEYYNCRRQTSYIKHFRIHISNFLIIS